MRPSKSALETVLKTKTALRCLSIGFCFKRTHDTAVYSTHGPLSWKYAPRNKDFNEKWVKNEEDDYGKYYPESIKSKSKTKHCNCSIIVQQMAFCII